MKRTLTPLRIFAVVFPLLLPLWAGGQEYRSIDGSGNNLVRPSWGAAGTPVLTGTIGFADGISAPAGQDRPNPRAISNLLFSQNNLANDPRGLSAYAWVWGQFIDHDITLSPDHPEERLDVAVPAFDQYFDPDGSGDALIPMFRSDYDPSSGTGPDNPRQYVNHITAFIDGSAVYGSDEARALWLRSGRGGKLKVSRGNLLPFNTVTGEYDALIDPRAPDMAMPLPHIKRWYVAGDVRANENPFLTSMHTLFMREHNRLCEELAQAHPFWTDNQLYQQARKLVSGIIQAIVFEEWLPTLGIELPPYNSYNLQVNPGIMNVFNSAAYRYGHTTINSLLVRMDNRGRYLPQGDILLRDAFFNPEAVREVDGIEPYLIGMATVVEQDFDCKVIDDLRNFLFGQPGAGGLDLVAINISRGRDRGLPDYNAVRADFGLPAIGEFSDITSDPLMSASLAFVYKDVENIDPWVGMLAEDHMPGALFGLTAMTILSRQFSALRDGDRFYYLNDPWISQDEKQRIHQTRLADVIRRNTPASNIQDDIFMARPFLTSLFSYETLEDVSLSVYPNPVQHTMSLRIEALRNWEAELRISNAQGQVLVKRSLRLAPGNNIVSLTLPVELSPGVYVASIVADGRVGSKQFVKI